MKIKSMALLLIVVSGFMLLLSPLSSLPTTSAQQERSLEQNVDTTNDKVDRPVDGGPCGRPPVEEATRQKVEEDLQRFNQGNVDLLLSPGSVTISVYFHVIRQGTSAANGNVPESVLDQQIQVLNDSFSGLTGGANTPFRFVKACVTRTTNASWFPMTYGSVAEQQAKTALHRGGANVLNFYTVSNSYGWAMFPWEYAGAPHMDGVAVPFTMLPNGTSAPFNQGDIGVHEVGHWLGLWHTFEGGCSATNDEVADTPAHLEPASVVGTCPVGRDSCPAPGLDPDDNFMCDTSDTCKRKFTPGQSTRMDQMYTLHRQNQAINPSASVSWLAPAEATWGPSGTMTVAGYAQNGCGGVQVYWRDNTLGGGWQALSSQATPNPSDNTWFNTIPSPYKCHNFSVYVQYSGITSPVFSYNGLNSGYCDEAASMIWIQPANSGTSGTLRFAGSATGAPSGTPVHLWYRNVTAGTGWVKHNYAPPTLPDGIWLIDVPNVNFFHVYQGYVEYDVVTSGVCTYWGNNTISWCQ